MGKWIILAGCILLLVGALVHFAPGLFSWIGKLPGDFRYQKGNFKFFFPLTTRILLSLALTLLIRVLGK